ncbi:hypothetical protein B7494_g8102 [Chlorociboria aeruginascens]|nr:hypothetical protein B7494_g8102 [Chlorociboria aeruginascens]
MISLPPRQRSRDAGFHEANYRMHDNADNIPGPKVPRSQRMEWMEWAPRSKRPKDFPFTCKQIDDQRQTSRPLETSQQPPTPPLTPLSSSPYLSPYPKHFVALPFSLCMDPSASLCIPLHPKICLLPWILALPTVNINGLPQDHHLEPEARARARARAHIPRSVNLEQEQEHNPSPPAPVHWTSHRRTTCQLHLEIARRRLRGVLCCVLSGVGRPTGREGFYIFGVIMSQRRDYHIVVLGAGKTPTPWAYLPSYDFQLTISSSRRRGQELPHCCAAQFVQNVWIESYDPTIEDSYRKQLEVDGRQCMLEILDTAGTEQFTAMRELYMKTGQGFLLVFSITSPSSLSELSELREQIIRIKDDENVPIVIVGNKSDLEEQRAVSRAKAFAVSQSWGNAPYYETSARRRGEWTQSELLDNVANLFFKQM